MKDADVRAQLRELESILGRVREFEERLEEIRKLVERRRELEPGVWGKQGTAEFTEWERALETVNSYYSDFLELATAAREQVGALHPVLGETEAAKIAKQLHPAGVTATRGALECAVMGVREYLEAQKSDRKARRDTAMLGGLRQRAGAGLKEGRDTSDEGSSDARRPGAGRSGGSPESAAGGGKGQVAPPWMPEHWHTGPDGEPGRWVTAKQFSEISGIPAGTLANWRHQDKMAGRTQPAPGKPLYRRFGVAVRYWLPRSLEHPYRSSSETSPSRSG